MQVVLNIPDNLSSIQVKQILAEINDKLKTEIELVTELPKLRQKVYAHLIMVDNIDLPSRDELYER
jgi:hypothetical protein